MPFFFRGQAALNFQLFLLSVLRPLIFFAIAGKGKEFPNPSTQEAKPNPQIQRLH